jgi:hypothetical protein
MSLRSDSRPSWIATRELMFFLRIDRQLRPASVLLTTVRAADRLANEKSDPSLKLLSRSAPLVQEPSGNAPTSGSLEPVFHPTPGASPHFQPRSSSPVFA